MDDDLYNPKDPFVCPKDPGFPRTNPMTWGWDVLTINPRKGSGFLGLSIIFHGIFVGPSFLEG